MEWRTVVVTVLVISLGFLAIPIRIAPDTDVQDVRLFESYILRYNKSYRYNPTEYDSRFKKFQVSINEKLVLIKFFSPSSDNI